MKKFLLLLLLLFPSRLWSQTSVALAPVPAQQFFSQAGVPLASGCVFTYITNTTTPLATYTDGTGGTPNTNPVILDGGGFGNIWLSNASYRFTIYSAGGTNCATGTFQRTVDSVSAYTIINQAQNLFLAGAASDPSGSAGEFAYRTDIPCFRAFTSFWDCLVTLTAMQTLTNKTLTAPTLTNPAINGVTPNAVVPGAGQVYTATGPNSAGFAVRTIAIPFIIDGGGVTLTTGTKGYVEIPFACTIIGWTALGDQSGSVVVDVKRSSYAGFPTTASIAGADKPTLASVQKNQNLTLSAWTTAINAGDIIEFNVNSATTITRVTVSLRATIP